MNNPVVANAHVEREFELVSAVDLDNDGIINRVYGMLKKSNSNSVHCLMPTSRRCAHLAFPQRVVCTDDGRARGATSLASSPMI